MKDFNERKIFMLKHLIFAIRFYPALILFGSILLAYAYIGLNQETIPTNEHFVSGVAMFGDLIYYGVALVAIAMIIYAWRNSVPPSQQLEH